MKSKKVLSEYEKGTIKVVWISRNHQRIYSKMFKGIEKARKFGETKGEYVIFSLEKQAKMEEFAWKLLPYGNYKIYLSIVNGYKKSKDTLKASKETLIDPLKKLIFS